MSRPANAEAMAVQHLAICRNERIPHQDQYYVRLAFTYGLTVPQIAEYADLPVETVRQMLVSG